MNHVQEKELRFMCNPALVHRFIQSGPKKGDWKISGIHFEDRGEVPGFSISCKAKNQIDVDYNAMVLRDHIKPWMKANKARRIK